MPSLHIDALDNVAEVIQRQSRDYVSCEKLEAYYGKNYEDHKDDYNWTEAMVNALYDKKCFRSSLTDKRCSCFTYYKAY